MGISGFVRCSCWENDQTSPPPVPRELINADAEGLYLSLDFDGNEEAFFAFDTWKRNACQHIDMHAASEGIASWHGYRQFQHALRNAGAHHFPTLLAELPNSNDGSMKPASAALAIDELSFFSEKWNFGHIDVLVDTDTGAEIIQSPPSYGGFFGWSAKERIHFGMANTEFVIRIELETCFQDAFRASRFEQILLEPTATAADNTGLVEFHGLDANSTFVCRTAVFFNSATLLPGQVENETGKPEMRFPRRLHVENRKINTDDFEHIIGALRNLFVASVAIGNPVVWT